MIPPLHVAVIMDGNGRWAKKRFYPRVFGHVRGASVAKNVIRAADDLGVKSLTLYAFSTENWSRPRSEVDVIFKILKKRLKSEIEELHERNTQLRFIGDLDQVDPSVKSLIDWAVDRLSGNSGLRLNVALSYGSRREIASAIRQLSRECIEGRMRPEEIDERALEARLWTGFLGPLGDVDLVIRTSGEFRVSNFLLWQSAHAEYRFLDVFWPDFTAKAFTREVEQYFSRFSRSQSEDSSAR